MKKTISTGQACVKFNNIALNDDSKEKELSDLMTSAELILFENKILLQVKLSSSEYALEELWEVGIDNEMNSSSILEPFGIEVIATNEEEFLIRLCASKVEEKPDEVNDWLTLVIIAKFNTKVPLELIYNNNFFQLYR
jgi:hypothetical protein